MTKPEFDVVNERRCRLIDRKFAGGLTPDEDAELEDLEDRVEAYLNEHFPLDFSVLEEFERLAEDLESRSAKRARE